MYGRWEGELWFHRWHMWPVPSSSTPSVAAPSNFFVFIDTNCFSKDGRKIHVGDCALFKPLDSSLPFVGIIRKLTVGKENNLTLSVNWLYRPADVKLKEGALLDAAPNEVFYSFHKDEIPAASLLHPCKVTFLRKGVELPSGISSFVCRRVYDIESKRLWWLTDQNYIKERQEEVNQLLDKTQIEMYGAVQTGGRSPKPLNGSNGTAQLKPSSDNVQNNSSISSHSKSRKREHGVHHSDSVKRERLSKLDDADSGLLRPEHIIKTEIAKITDKGGLVDFGGVEKLIQLMRPESAEGKLDLACRTMLVDVISVTDRFDCLGWFVQLRGLSVLDEWLQEIHKGKIGDGSPKENDKSVKEFLLSLLRALDKLPVNLHALQTCNVGKSVNHLSSHKNSEIQKKARFLVNTWKRRVEAEMNIIETKSSTSRGGYWPSKSVMSEVSHMDGSSEAGPKSSMTQPSALKAQQPKHNSGDAVIRSPTSPGSTKLLTQAAAGAGSSDMPSSAAKEGRSCSSSQSPNNCKSMAACREDALSSAAGSSSVSKKEGSVGSVNRNFASEKKSPTRHTSERVSDVSLVDNGNSQRLIVRLPNTGRSPASTVCAESHVVSYTVSSKDSLLISSEMQDHQDQMVNVSEKADSLQGNNTLNIGTPGKDGLVGRDEAKVLFDERGRNGGVGERMTSGSSTGVTPKQDTYSSINVLVESCAKFSETSVSPSVRDDVGMSLLASVAAGEMSRSDVPPVCSPGSNSPLPEASCSVNAAKLRRVTQDGGQREDNMSVANGHTTGEQINSVDLLPLKGISPQQVLPVANHISGDSKNASVGCEVKTDEDNRQLDLPQNGNTVVMAPEVKTADLIEDAPEGDKNAAATIAQVETQINEESASWTSSDMQEDEKKLVHKRSSSSTLSSPEEPHVRLEGEKATVATTSCGDVEFARKSEEADVKKPGILAEQSQRQNMDSGTSNLQHSSEHAQENMETNKGVGRNPGGSAATDRTPTVAMQELRSCEKPCGVAEAICVEDPNSRVSFSMPVEEMAVKLDFDLNEGLPGDDGIQGEVERSCIPESSAAVHSPSPSLPAFGSRSVSITVAAAAKGSFYPSENLLRCKAELGWKGSAATSAFRPAEPRKVLEVPDNHTSKQVRPLLDFDLNVGVVEDAASVNSGGGLDFDLNACEENPGLVHHSVSSSGRPGMVQLPPRSLLSNSEPNSSRGFDLNDGPGVEGESVPFSRNGVQYMSAIPNVRVNNMDNGNISSWFPPAITVPSVLPGRGDQSYPQRMLSPVTASNPEIFRGPVLSSSPAVAFQYPGFPFETNFSLPPSISNTTYSAVDSSSSGGALCFPTIPSQAQVSMPYRPYFMSLPGGSDSRKWGSHGLDLNAGPGVGSEEQLKMFQQMTAKRKEPDGDGISYKHHPSWQ